MTMTMIVQKKVILKIKYTELLDLKRKRKRRKAYSIKATFFSLSREKDTVESYYIW